MLINRWNPILRLVASVLVTICVALPVFSVAAIHLPASQAQGPGPLYAEGELLVKLRPSAERPEVQAAMAEAGLFVLAEVRELGIQRLSVPAGKELEYARSLVNAGLVEYAEPNYRVYIAREPNDPYWPLQWNMQLVEAPAGWDISTGSAETIIAILDTGIDLTHPDLQAKLVPGRNMVNPYASPADDHGHGTHVAGITAASTHNSRGVAGLDWQARLMPVKVLDSVGTGTYADIINGIYYATNNGARIINMSLAGWEYSSALHDAVRYAANTKGCFLVAAAGNCAQGGPACPGINPVAYPAAYSEVIAVGAVTANDIWGSYSGWGGHLDIVAPGGTHDNMVLSTGLNGSYSLRQGTSMATPHVAGLASLIWSVDPSLTRTQVWQVIRDTAVKVGTDPYVQGRNDRYGFGRIDVAAALSKSAAPRLVVTPTQVSMLSGGNWNLLPARVEVKNAGPYLPLVWSATFTSGSEAFELVSQTSGTLSAGSSISILINTKSGSLSGGTYGGTLRITATGDGVQGSPQTIPLSVQHLPELQLIFSPLVIR